MARKKQLAVALATAIFVVGTVYGVGEQNWVPAGLYLIGLVEWGLSTLWTRTAVRDDVGVAGAMTFVNAVIAFMFVTITNLVIAKNPDGALYVAVNMFGYGVGSALGTTIAILFFSKK